MCAIYRPRAGVVTAGDSISCDRGLGFVLHNDNVTSAATGSEALIPWFILLTTIIIIIRLSLVICTNAQPQSGGSRQLGGKGILRDITS